MKKGLRVLTVILFCLLFLTGCEEANENQLIDLETKEVSHGDIDYKNKYTQITKTDFDFDYNSEKVNLKIDELNDLVVSSGEYSYTVLENVSKIYHDSKLDSDDIVIVYSIDNSGLLRKSTIRTDWSNIDEMFNNIITEIVDIDDTFNEFVNVYNTDTKDYTDIGLYSVNNVIYYLSSLKIYDPNRITIGDKYVLYDDKTLSTLDGKFFVDAKGDAFKIKNYSILNNEISANILDENQSDTYKTNVIFITENNELIIETDNNKLFKYGSKINKIGNSGTYPYIKFKNGVTFVLNSSSLEEITN